jgi:hypothetical protein
MFPQKTLQTFAGSAKTLSLLAFEIFCYARIADALISTYRIFYLGKNPDCNPERIHNWKMTTLKNYAIRIFPFT